MARFYVITESGVDVYTSQSQLKRETNLQTVEFTKMGADYVAQMTDHDYGIARDIKQLEAVASRKVFQKDQFGITDFLLLGLMLVVIVKW